MADSYSDRFHIFKGQEIQEVNGDYNVDEDQLGTTDYTIENPDFTFDEFLSNFVLRWEFVPGSTLFMVWSQSRDADSTTGEMDLMSNVKTLFAEEKPYDVFLIKLSYRIGLN